MKASAAPDMKVCRDVALNAMCAYRRSVLSYYLRQLSSYFLLVNIYNLQQSLVSLSYYNINYYNLTDSV